MSNRVKEAFEIFFEQMGAPPTWEEASTPRAVPPSSPSRSNRPGWAAAIGTGVVVVSGAVALLFANGQASSTTVPYVQLAWSQAVEMRCEGMEVVDNGGFNEAVVEIWGEPESGPVRIDATAPDGTTETLIVELDDVGRVIQAWSSFVDEEDTVFRIAECERQTGTTSESYSLTDPPFDPSGGFQQEFVGFPAVSDDGFSVDVAALMGQNADSQRQDVWLGNDVDVYSYSDEFTDELGFENREEERWVDLANRRYERLTLDYNFETLGHIELSIDTIERSEVTISIDFFSTEHMVETRNLTDS